MKLVAIIFIILSFLEQGSVKCQEVWTLRKEKNGIKVLTHKNKNYKFDEIEVECEFEGRISQLAALLLDVDNQYLWVYKTLKSTLIKRVNPADVFFYTEIDCPWPYENRDLIVHMSIAQNPVNKVMTIIANNAEGVLPDKKDITRVKYSRAVWTITPLINNKFKIDYKVQIDLGPDIPAWLLNMFSSNAPYETFMNLKEKIKLPQYVKAKFPFLLD